MTESVNELKHFFVGELPQLLLQVPQATEPGKRKRKEKRDPLAPKQPLSAYLLFSQEMRPKLKDEMPDLDPKMVLQEVGKRWKEISAVDKKVVLVNRNMKIRLLN